MKTISYIIGDIHGQADLLERLLENIQSRHQWKSPHKSGRLIYLGDYIDRGPNSLGVIDLAMKGIAGFQSIFLKGNHEQLLLKVLEADERADWNNWMSAGGEASLRSFGYNFLENKYNSSLLRECLGEGRVSWLKSLRLFYELNDLICVHAGLAPEVALEDQNEKDLLWIRRRFLESNYDFGCGVIHGHTPSDRPVVKRNRICLDTGAGMGGELTALVVSKPWLEMRSDPDFMSVS